MESGYQNLFAKSFSGKYDVSQVDRVYLKKAEVCGVQSGVRDKIQLKSRLVRIMGAIRVQLYRAKHTQLELIFTHTAGHLLVIV